MAVNTSPAVVLGRRSRQCCSTPPVFRRPPLLVEVAPFPLPSCRTTSPCVVADVVAVAVPAVVDAGPSTAARAMAGLLMSLNDVTGYTSSGGRRLCTALSIAFSTPVPCTQDDGQGQGRAGKMCVCVRACVCVVVARSQTRLARAAAYRSAFFVFTWYLPFERLRASIGHRRVLSHEARCSHSHSIDVRAD